MTIEKLKDKWPLYVVMLAANVLILFCTSCPSTVQSLNDPSRMVTRVEFQIELDQMMAIAQIRMAHLDTQDSLRNIILKNALLMVETGTINPLGIATALFASYGIGNAACKVKNGVKKKTKPPT